MKHPSKENLLKAHKEGSPDIKQYLETTYPDLFEEKLVITIKDTLIRINGRSEAGLSNTGGQSENCIYLSPSIYSWRIDGCLLIPTKKK